MAYVNVRANMPKKEQPKPEEQSTLSKAIDLTETGMKASKFLNKRNERLLAESGYLDLKLPAKEILKTDSDGKEYFSTEPKINMFVRKPGKGPLRKPEDRIKFSQEAKEHFVKLAKEQNFDADGNPTGNRVLPEELMTEYIDSLGEGSQGLKNISDLKNMDKSVKDREKWVESLNVSKEVQSDLMNQANIRGKEFVNKISSGGFGKYGNNLIAEDKKTGMGFTSDYLPSRAKGNLSINPDLISGKKSGFSGAIPDFIPQKSANVGLDKSNILSNIGLVDKARSNVQNQAQGLVNSLNFRNKFGEIDKLRNLAQNPKAALENKVMTQAKDKIMSSVGIKPNFLSGLGPGGFLAQMALGQLGGKLFKPHTVAGKLFKGLFG